MSTTDVSDTFYISGIFYYVILVDIDDIVLIVFQHNHYFA